MAAVADAIDTLVDLLQGTTKGCVDRSWTKGTVVVLYATFALFWLYVWGAISHMKFSTLLTSASCVQALGFSILIVKVHGTKSVKGISSKMLEMFLLYLSSRLTATCLKTGYIPVDKTGDYVYQFCDMCSLMLVLHLMFCVHRTYAHTYEDEKDSFSISTMAVPCFVLAWFVHGRHNKSFFFDTCWAFSTNLESMCVVPQLWMMMRQGGKVDWLLGHFVATVVLSGLMTCWFWYYNYQSLEAKGPTQAGKVLFAAHVLKVVLCADFSYFYISALVGGTSVVLPNREGELNI